MSDVLTIQKYLQSASGATFPPLMLEVILKSGRSFYVKDVFKSQDEEPDVIALRVWDLRALAEEDIQQLTAKLNRVRNRDELSKFEKLHPRLDQGNLWVRISEIEGIMEWHDRIWPQPEKRERKVGF